MLDGGKNPRQNSPGRGERETRRWTGRGGGKKEEWGRKKQGREGERRARIFFFFFFWSRSRREDRDIFARDRQTLKMLSAPWERCHPTSKIPRRWYRVEKIFLSTGIPFFRRDDIARKLFKIGGGRKRKV